MRKPLLRSIFKYLNRFFMVPAFRLGLGKWIVSPLSGYIMLLGTTGRKSGKARYTPLNYAIMDGNIYCIAGWGKYAHWLGNLQADPHVSVTLPGGALAGIAEEVTDEEEAHRALVQVVHNAGFAALFGDMNPLKLTDEELVARAGYAPLIRIHSTGVAPGPNDPGGWGWVLPVLLQAIGLAWLIGRLRHRSHAQAHFAR